MDEPFIADDGPWRTLRFSRTAYQSRMHREAPDDLVTGYTRTMMGCLLFVPAPDAIAMIGLGGGSLARYCRRSLPDTRFVAVEVNPKVVALRDDFALPADDAEFAIVEADGAAWVRETDETFDVLMLDAFTSEGIPPALRTPGFYADCRDRITADGVLVANCWAGDPRTTEAVARLREVFDGQVVGIRSEDPGHRIGFAGKGLDLHEIAAVALARARVLQERHPIDLVRIATALVTRITGRAPREPAA